MKSKFANLIILTIDVYILYIAFDGCYHRINPILLDYGNAYRNLHVSSELMATVIVSYLPVYVAVDQFSKLFSIDKEKREEICKSTMKKMTYFMVISFITEAWIAKVITICNDNSIHISNIQSKNGLSSFLGLTMGWHIVFGTLDFFLIKRMIFGKNRKKIRNDIHANKEDRSFEWFMLLLDLFFIFFITYIFLTTDNKVSYAPLLLLILLIIPLLVAKHYLNKILKKKDTKDTIFEDDKEKSQIKAKEPAVKEVVRRDRESYFDILIYDKEDLQKYLATAKENAKDDLDYEYQFIKDNKIDEILEDTSLQQLKSVSSKLFEEMSNEGVESVDDLLSRYDENTLAKRFCIRSNVSHTIMKEAEEFKANLSESQLEYSIEPKVDFYDGFVGDNQIIKAIYHYREEMKYYDHIKEYYDSFLLFYENHKELLELYDNVDAYENTDLDTQKNANICNNEVYNYLRTKKHKTAMELTSSIDGDPEKIYNDFFNHQTDYLDVANSCTDGKWSIYDSEKEDTKYNVHIKVSSKGLSNADQSKRYYESALKHELRNTLYTLNLAHDEFLKAEGYASVEAHQENIKKAVNNKLRKYNLVGVHDLKELYEVVLKRYEDSASIKELDDNLLLLKELSGYKDIYQYIAAHEQKKKSMISKEYNHAVDLANAHKFEEALIVCEAISSYTNVNDLRKKINVLRNNNDKRIGLYEYLVNQYTNANTLEIYDKLYYAFKELDGYKDAYKYMNQCKKHIDSMNAIKDRKEKKYQTARDMYKKSRTVQDYLKVQDLFSALHGYNDSQFYLNSISKEIRRLRELDAEKTNKSDNIFEDNGLGQLSDEEIQAILAMRQTKIIEKEDMSNTSEVLNDNHDKKKVEIEEDHKLITNSIFTINYSITDTNLDDCIYTIAIKDEFGSTMSDTKEINTNDANRKVTLTLKAGTTFDKTKDYKIVLINKNNGKVLQEKKCKIDIVFTSDFDF
ncbi:hypothetical protein SAMN04487759_10587 [Kandleria vitulina]|uniref:Uncharacterized protein n=1 Tax=Kandleria vitulina TaxID=1630 RepID=A0A1H2RE87_9FIRM|nr:hypothetical protein [Kandleria vitulina]SDW17470.1 hypothetical protein SAMN04487759_10587 [Kandleria vitulina]